MRKRWIAGLLAAALCMQLIWAQAAGETLWEQGGFASQAEFQMQNGLDWGMSEPLPEEAYQELETIYQDALSLARQDASVVLSWFGWEDAAEAGYADWDEACRSYAYDQAMDRLWDMQDRYQFRKTYGVTTEDSIYVQCNGQMIVFPDQMPKNRSGQVMVPLRALAEAMGGSVETADGLVVRLGDRATFLTVGQDFMTVTDAAGERTVQMQAAPYVSQGRTYVPVRDFAEAQGWMVSWNGRYQTVVLLDKDGVIAEINQDFTAANHLLPSVNPSSAWKSLATMAFCFSNDEMEIPLALTWETLEQGRDVSAEISFDIAALVPFFLGTEADEQTQQILETLEDGKAAVRYDGQNDVLYLKSDTLFRLMQLQGGIELPDGMGDQVWFRLSGLGLQNLFVPAGESITLSELNSIGEMLYEFATNTADPIDWYRQMDSGAEALSYMLGDARFVRQGGGWVSDLRYDGSQLSGSFLPEAVTAETLAELERAGVSQIQYRLYIGEDGAYDGSLLLHAAADTAERGVLELTLSGDREQANAAFSLQFASGTESIDVVFDYDGAATDEKVPLEPDDGTLVIDLNPILGL